MKASDMFPSKYLKASDLGEESPIVTISNVAVEELGADEKETKPVVYFNDQDKGLVCNKTNWSTLINLFGDDTDIWTGKKIKLMVAEVAFQGKMTLCIRISSIKVAQGGAKVAPAAKKAVKIENQTEAAVGEGEDIAF